MIKNLVCLCMGFTMSVSALAHPGHDPSSMGKNTIHNAIATAFTKEQLPQVIFKAIEGNLPAMNLIKSDYMDDKPWVVFHRLQHMDETAYPSLKAKDKSYFLMHLIKHKYPKAKSYWKHSVQWEGITVTHSRDLINPEQMPLSGSSLKEKEGKRTVYMEASPFIETSTFAMTNRHRMRTGLAPVGPDNRGIVICRLLQDRNAPYYEMARSDASSLIKETQSGMSFAQACLSEPLTGNYWVQRAKDFETPYGEELSKD